MKRQYDALIESYQAWLSWQRSRYDGWREGESEVEAEIARLRKLQDEQLMAAA